MITLQAVQLPKPDSLYEKDIWLLQNLFHKPLEMPILGLLMLGFSISYFIDYDPL